MKNFLSILGAKKVPRDVRNPKTGNMTSSIEIRTNANPNWDRIRCPEELASSVG